MRGITLGLFLTVCSIVTGNTYYVSPNGSNTNPGTIGSPWATFSYAFNYNLSPGDTVYFRGGVYYTTSAQGITSNPGLVGTSSDPICFFNYPGERPIVDGRNKTSESHGITFYYSSHVKFRGIVVRNHAQFSSDGFPSGWNLYYCTDLSFEQCEVANIGGRGFAFRWCSRATLINCDAHDVNNNISSSPGGDGDGFFMSPSYHNFTGRHYFYGCRAWRCSDDGWDVENLGQTVIESCWSFNNGFQAYDDPGLGNGFKLNLTPAEDVSLVSRIVTNCIAAYNRRTGFTTNDNGSGARNMHIDNNTSYANGKYGEDGYGFQVYNTGSSETNEQYRTFRNNIGYANTTLDYRLASGASCTVDANSWDSSTGVTITNADFISVDSTGLARPRQSSGSLPNLTFLKLASTSDLIDAGNNVGLSFSGAAPDLGYAEYTSGSVEPAIPIYLSSAIDNATPSTLTMTYNLSLASILPAASSFAVRVNSTARTVSSVTISGTRVILTLASPVVYGDAVTVAYTKPATNPLQTTAGGQAASITAQNVTNNVAVVAVFPVYVSSAIDNATPSTLTMTYNLSLASILPAASSFAVRVNSTARTVSSVTISGTRVILTLASPVVYGDAVTVAYTKPATNPLQTTAGGQAASITAQNVTNNVAVVAVIPVYSSSAIDNATPSTLTMTYNLSLASILPAASSFAVRVNSTARTVSSVTISGTRVILTLASPVVYGDAVTVAYTKPATNPLQTTAGGQAASITAQNVTNNVAVVAVIPVYVSSAIDNATPSTLTMTYNLSLASILPAASSFAVRVNSTARTVSSVTISGTRVILTLASPVVYGDAVTVAYTKPATNPLQTTAGGQAASITAQNVTNNVAVVAVIPVYVSSAIDNATPSTLTMTYNLSLASILPAASSFAVRVNSTARTVSSVTISGTRVILTLASPVVYGDAVTVAYTKPATNPLQTTAGGQAASITAQNVTNSVAEPGNQLPVVTISSPTKSTAFIVPATITIDAVAYDPDGTVSKVEFYNGNVKLGEILTAPYSYIWKEVPEGTYIITAVATDNKNAKRTSEAVTVVVEKSTTAINQVPVVVITNPRNKKPRKNERVNLVAEAYDPDGSISSVEFKSGGVLLATDNTAPYEMIWEAVDTGTFVITVVAIDNLGAPSNPIGIEFIVDPDFRANSELIKLYPNPNNGNFSVELETQLPEEKNTYTIFNLRGDRVYEEEGTGQENIRNFNVSQIKSGTYVLMITSGKTIIATKKFIKE